jgi:hypothetical protein
MAALQAQMVEFNAVQVRLTELHHKDTTTLAENTAKHLGIDKSELLPEKTLIVGVKTEA